MRIVRIFREIRNYMFLLRTIRNNRRTPEWNKHNLRTNWFGTIATVINMPPDVYKGEAIYYQVYVIEQMKPINRYLESLNLQEIISPRTISLVDPKVGQYAYLVKYMPLLRDFTFWWVVSRGAIIITLLWLQAKYSIFTQLWDLCVYLIGKIF